MSSILWSREGEDGQFQAACGFTSGRRHRGNINASLIGATNLQLILIDTNFGFDNFINDSLGCYSGFKRTKLLME